MNSSNSIIKKIGEGIFATTQASLFLGGISALAYYTANINEITQVEVNNVLKHIYYTDIVQSAFFILSIASPIANKHYTQRIANFLSNDKK